MKIVFFIYFLLLYFTKVNCFEQLIQPGITVATSSSVGWGGFANKTVDGNYAQNNYTYCMHTAGGQLEAWLRIDLGGVYNLKNVTIWYRSYTKIESENTKGFKGFSIRLSKSPDLVSSEICYQDPGKESLPVMISRPCKGVARYVWFYTDKDNGGGVFLEICEVDVYGCRDKHYGENCSKCNGCNDTCDIISGECSCTKTGYRPPECVRTCNEGYYGKDCRFPCGHCANKTICNHVNGKCPSGKCEQGWTHRQGQQCNRECKDGTFGSNCKNKCSGHCSRGLPCRKTDGICVEGCAAGWITPSCSKECDDEKFGNNCQETCSGHCRGWLPCNKTDGICPAGCANGWINSYCNETCSHGFYGWECRFRCGKCAKNAKCNHANGSCPYGDCMPGFKQTNDQRCDKECDNGNFGNICEKKCSGHCAGGLPCDKTDGVCPTGCENGWMSPSCNETCKRGLYGKKCSLSCGFCALNATCDHVTGSCPSGVCLPGWKNTQDKRCNKVCPDGTYGSECKSICSEGCLSVCDKKNGTCEKCREGYTGAFCIDAHALQRRMTSIVEVAGITTSIACFSILFALVLKRERVAAM